MPIQYDGQLELFTGGLGALSVADQGEHVHPGHVGRSPTRIPPGMLEVCVLGSGSGGNSAAVRLSGAGGGDSSGGGSRGATMLIDAGFGPATTARRLLRVGTGVDVVRAICLTHLDQDHFRPAWVPTLLGLRVCVYLHRWHLPDWSGIPGAAEMAAAGLVKTFDRESFEPLPGVRVTAVRLAHDQQGTSGFMVESAASRVGYATDLGHVPDELVERFAGADVVALESNYDPPMQLRSPRPLFLKRRIMGPAGHLSNQQAFEAVRRIVDASPMGNPRHILLLHRSQQCNHPDMVRTVFAQDPRIAPRVVLTQQRRPTRWYSAVPLRGAARRQLHFRF